MHFSEAWCAHVWFFILCCIGMWCCQRGREPPISLFDSKWVFIFIFLSQRCKRKLKIKYEGYKKEQQIPTEKLVHSLQQESHLLTVNARYADLGWWFMAKFVTPLSLWTGLNDYFWNSQIFWRWIAKLRLLWSQRFIHIDRNFVWCSLFIILLYFLIPWHT